MKPNTHFAAFFEIYKIFMLLHTSDIKNLSKKRVKMFAGMKKKEISVHSRFSMNFAIIRRQFDDILPELHRN